MERQSIPTPQRLLVTGGSGFIGSAFIRRLLSVYDWDGRVLNVDSMGYAANPDNLAAVAHDPRYQFLHGDIAEEAVWQEVVASFKPDTIVHFAAESHVDRSIHGPEAFIRSNIVGTFRLLEAARQLDSVHVHHVSTDEVYGALGDEGLFTEDSPYDPTSPYAASKASSDHLVRSWAKTFKLSITISNCSNNYGPFQFPEKLIPLMSLNALEGKALPVYGDGQQIRDWLHVDDHCDAIWRILESGRPSQTYNIGARCERANLDVVHGIIDTAAEVRDVPREQVADQIVHVADRPAHDRRYAIDPTKLESELGWTPKHTFDTGLAQTVRWYAENREWVDRVRTGAYRDWMAANYAERQA